MIQPLDKVYITQGFGKNPDIYKRFGILGHNGIDYRAPINTPVYAPHDGVIKERHNDVNGYGKYIKIQNEKEGSVLAHFKDWEVNINQKVMAGQLVGHADNTGFSTGSHLHWGWYPLPKDRNNGYNGYVDQQPLLLPDMPNYIKPLLNNDLGLDLNKSEGDVRARVAELKTAYDKYEEQKREIKKLKGRVESLGNEMGGFNESLKTAVEDRTKLEKELKEEKEMRIRRDKNIFDLAEEIKTLKETLDPDSKIVISKEEYKLLTKHKTLDRHTTPELIKETLRRLLTKAQAWFRRWFTLPEGLKETKPKAG